MNPIIRRELLEVLRQRRLLVIQIALAVSFALLVLVRWPTSQTADLTGTRSLQVLRVFGYGFLAGIILLVPAFPATSLVREKIKGTLVLLLNSPMPAWSIYLGKLGGVLGITGVLLAMTLPAAGACHALGGASSQGGILTLYAVLGVAALQFSTLALLVSSRSQTTDGALRTTYSLVLALCVLVLAPHAFLRGGSGPNVEIADGLRHLSPIPAVMDLLGQGDVGSQGMSNSSSRSVVRYLGTALVFSLFCAIFTIFTLNHNLLDRARAAGIMTEDRSTKGKWFRRLLYLVDPQRRSRSTPLWINPVLVKEFRSRRFGRSHWTLRLIALCGVVSLGMSYIAASGSLGWGIEVIGGALVLLQIALLILFAPSLAAGLISSERENGSWQLLRMTPLSPGAILRAKLMSVAWPLFLILCATLPGYIVMMTIKPSLVTQVQR
ncbi:MAG: ABC transporter permease, partial [Gemmataceae bacterium]